MTNPLLIPRILWFALLSSVALITAFAFLLRPPVPPAPPPPGMPIAFGALAAALTVVSFLLPRIVFSRALRGMDDLVTEELDPDAPALFREAAPKRRVVRLDDRQLADLMPRYQPLLVVSLALSEAVALLGFVLSRLGFDLRIASAFLGAGALLILVGVPRKRAIVEAIERATGAAVIDETGRG